MSLPSVYFPSPSKGSALLQGEIISNITSYTLDINELNNDKHKVDFFIKSFAVIISQDCDLEQDFNRRLSGKEGNLPNVLLCEAQLLSETDKDIQTNSKINQNEIPRYHVLSCIPQECDSKNIGIDKLIIDFKSIFSISTSELYKRVELDDCIRRAVLNIPYNIDLIIRYLQYSGRVPLPIPHHQISPTNKLHAA